MKRDDKLTAAYLKNIIAVMPGHIYWEDKEGVLLGCNDLMAKTLGVKKSELIGKSSKNYIPAEKYKAIKSINERVMQTGSSHTIEENTILPSGKEAIFLTKKSPLFNDNNEIIGVVGVSFDVTDRKMAQKQLALAKDNAETASIQKTRFIATMNNVLRTPINNIALSLDLLKKTVLTEEQKKLLEVIDMSNKGMLPQIMYAADYANLESDAIEFIESPFEVLRYVELAVVEKYKAALTKQIDIFIDKSNYSNGWVNADFTRFKQVVEILIDNAIKYTSSGYVRIILSNKSSLPDYIRITIQDTGIGITKQKLGELFQFKAVTQKRNQQVVDVSLRLSYCKKAIEKMRGHISVSSKEDKGTSFCIDLPIFQQQVLQNEKNIQPYVDIQKLKYLIFDVCSERAQAIRSYLKGFDITIFNSIGNLKNLLGTKLTYNVILIDQSMLDPSVIGYLKNLAENHCILIINFPYSEETSDDLMRYSNVFSLEKPFRTGLLQKKLNDIWVQFKKPTVQVLLVEDDLLCQTITRDALQTLKCSVDVASSGEKALEMSLKNYDLIFMDSAPGMVQF